MRASCSSRPPSRRYRRNLAGLAQQFRSVADGPVKQAAEDAVKMGLASDQPQARHDSQASAAATTPEALVDLRQIASQLQHTAKDRPAGGKSLERLAKDQQALANALLKNPNDPNLLQQQKDLQGQLDKLNQGQPAVAEARGQRRPPAWTTWSAAWNRFSRAALGGRAACVE